MEVDFEETLVMLIKRPRCANVATFGIFFDRHDSIYNLNDCLGMEELDVYPKGG